MAYYKYERGIFPTLIIILFYAVSRQNLYDTPMLGVIGFFRYL